MSGRNIKAVFFDIDGTLVPFGDREVPAAVRDAIADLRKRGIKVFISTGRHIHWINNLGDTEFDGYVTANGAMCLLADKKTCIFKHCVPQEDIDRLTDFAGESELSITVIPAFDEIFTTRDVPQIVETQKLIGIPAIPVKDIRTAPKRDVVQLMAFGDEGLRLREHLFENVLKDCEATSWNPLFCDIIPKGSNKSTGIDRMIRHFGIDIEETMAFGDGENDISMLRHCGIGVAMGNAGDNVKEAADYVTTDVRDNGVVNALNHFGF